MTGRPEDIAPVVSGLEQELHRLRGLVVPGPGGEAPAATVMHVPTFMVDQLVTWFRTEPVCVCACHRDAATAAGFTHEVPCCDQVTDVQVVEEQQELHARQLVEWSSLPAYQDVVCCPKCGNEQAVTFFCSKQTRFATTMFGGRPFTCEYTAPGQRDHMHRVCTRCSFPWTERPLDDVVSA